MLWTTTRQKSYAASTPPPCYGHNRPLETGGVTVRDVKGWISEREEVSAYLSMFTEARMIISSLEVLLQLDTFFPNAPAISRSTLHKLCTRWFRPFFAGVTKSGALSNVLFDIGRFAGWLIGQLQLIR